MYKCTYTTICPLALRRSDSVRMVVLSYENYIIVFLTLLPSTKPLSTPLLTLRRNQNHNVTVIFGNVPVQLVLYSGRVPTNHTDCSEWVVLLVLMHKLLVKCVGQRNPRRANEAAQTSAGLLFYLARGARSLTGPRPRPLRLRGYGAAW